MSRVRLCWTSDWFTALAKASLTACWHYNTACFIRKRESERGITLKCLFWIKREMTWPCLSWSTTGPVNPDPAVLQRSRLAPARLLLIRVHILNGTWTNDQILLGINSQAGPFNLWCIVLKELSYSLISLWFQIGNSQILLLLIELRGGIRREHMVHYGERSKQQTLLESLCVVLCCGFGPVLLFLPQGIVNTRGLG